MRYSKQSKSQRWIFMSSWAAVSPPQILFYIVGANSRNIIDLIVHSIIFTKQTKRQSVLLGENKEWGRGEQPFTFPYYPTISRISFQKSIAPCCSTLRARCFKVISYRKSTNALAIAFLLWAMARLYCFYQKEWFQKNESLVPFITLLSAFDFYKQKQFMRQVT